MEFEMAISFFIGGKNMRHIGEKIILVLCIVVFGIAAMNLVEIEKEYYDGQKEYEELKRDGDRLYAAHTDVLSKCCII